MPPAWQRRTGWKRSCRKVGASTGTNMWGALQLAARMREAGRTGSIVTLLCDSGERYLETYYNAEWVQANIGDITRWKSCRLHSIGNFAGKGSRSSTA